MLFVGMFVVTLGPSVSVVCVCCVELGNPGKVCEC